MRLRKLNHSTYQHQFHIVWGTKYRYKILKPYVLLELKKSLYSTVKKYPTLWIEVMSDQMTDGPSFSGLGLLEKCYLTKPAKTPGRLWEAPALAELDVVDQDVVHSVASFWRGVRPWMPMWGRAVL